MCYPNWLPDLLLFQHYGGDWNTYCDALYEGFKEDFHSIDFDFDGKRIGLKKHPQTYNRECTFWHMIQEGSVEDDRTPDFRRCERIRWPMAIIRNRNSEEVKVWRNKRGNKDRIYLLVEAARYIVVLDERSDYVLPWTAFYIQHDNSLRRLLREYEKCRA